MSKYTAVFDALIASNAGTFLPEWDWLWLKAQYLQESLLDPNARSSVGAEGIAQFMPETWKRIARQLKFPPGASPLDAEFAIKAGAYYMSTLRRAWWMGPRSEDDRRRLAQASYNAGLGNILKAQRACDNALAYDVIIAALPKITRANAAQTIGYVTHIENYYRELKAEAA